MPFNLEETDRLLSTTRSVRRRLDLNRSVPEQVLLDCIDLAEQAPTGGNQASRRWLVVRDPKIKENLGEIYRHTGGAWLSERAKTLTGSGDPRESAVLSGAYLADHLHQVPVLLLVTIYGRHDASGRPGLFDSVIQSAWSFCLAARSRGLATTWTTLHLSAAEEVEKLLGIPNGVTQIVLLPVAYSLGEHFSAVERRPAREITWFDRWGHTLSNPTEGQPLRHENGAGVTVEIEITTNPAEIWPFVTDIQFPALFSDEFLGAEWIDNYREVGARFVGRNHREDMGTWEAICTVVEYQLDSIFAWHVGDADNPAAQWKFELEPLLNTTRLRFSMTLGPGPSGLTAAIKSMPDKEASIIAKRQREQAANMRRTLEGIKKAVTGIVSD